MNDQALLDLTLVLEKQTFYSKLDNNNHVVDAFFS